MGHADGSVNPSYMIEVQPQKKPPLGLTGLAKHKNKTGPSYKNISFSTRNTEGSLDLHGAIGRLTANQSELNDMVTGASKLDLSKCI